MSGADFRYDVLVENALRTVVRQVLEQVSENGLTGEQHFYITFRTGDDGVAVPDYLRKRYPAEMTIVLQYQFYGLEIAPDHFAVTLTFNNVPERLEIPFEAITVFADPSVNFALQFQGVDSEDELTEGEAELHELDQQRTDADADAEAGADGDDTGKGDDDPPGGEVVSLDHFRKNR